MMKLITLLTDFGLQDGYPGIMKGVIWSIAPDVQIADLTHEIPPQDVLSGAQALGRAAPYFPAGTIHVGVVDPGVGTARRPIAARLGGSYFVGPDNGLFTMLANRTQAMGEQTVVVKLERSEYWLSEVSNTFQGRDIFAPVGAHLANGTALEALGPPVRDPVMLTLPKPGAIEGGWEGQVTHVDHFGNLATNLNLSYLDPLSVKEIRVGGKVINGLRNTFGEGQPGELLAFIDSSGSLSMGVVNGNAAQRLELGAGAPVVVLVSDRFVAG
jgi:S-adenosyl-L-methionine hydrolase (adenosine-forming)